MKLIIIFVTACLLGTLVYLYGKNVLTTTTSEPSSVSTTSVTTNTTTEEQPVTVKNSENNRPTDSDYTEVETIINGNTVKHKELTGLPVAFTVENSSLHPALTVYYKHVTLLSEGKVAEASVFTTDPETFESTMKSYRERLGEAGFKAQFSKLFEPDAANTSAVFVIDNVAFVVIEFDGIFGANPMILKNGMYKLAQDEAELSDTQKAFLEYYLEKANS